jgi:putative ABC transport system substrate-binding protein
MKRRTFIARLGGAAAWPLVARAQQKVPIVGILGTASAASMGPWVAAFEQRFRELGWTEKRATIEVRWADGRPEKITEIANEFVRLKVDIVITTGTSVPAITRVTSTIPIVFAIANDPVGVEPRAARRQRHGSVAARGGPWWKAS